MAKKPTLTETLAATKDMVKSPFVNYDLSEEDKKAFKAWFHQHLDDLWDSVDKLLDSSYHISIKWDAYNGCYGAFLICKAPGSPQFGMILTGRGKTALVALGGAIFRHYVIFEEHWNTDGYRRSGTDDE